MASLVCALVAQQQLQQPDRSPSMAFVLYAAAAGLLLVQPYHWHRRLEAWNSVALPFLLSGTAFGVTLYLHAQPNQNPGLITTAWFVAIAAFVLGCWEYDLRQGNRAALAVGWTRLDLAVVVCMFALGLFLRGVGIATVPMTFNGDEGSMGLEAVRVLDGVITDPFSTGWLSHPTLWFFLQSFSLRLFSEPVTGLRMLSVLIGSATIVTTYCLARLLYSQRIALVATILLATYHFHIHYSRMALNNIADPLFGTLLMISATWAYRTRKWLSFGVTGVLLGLALYFYHGTRLFIPLLLLLGAVQLLQVRPYQCQPLRRGMAMALVLVIGALLAAGPLLQTFYQRPGEFSARLAVHGVTPRWLAEEAHTTGRSVVSVLGDQFQHALLAFNRYPDRSPFYDNSRPLLWGMAGALMILGLVLTIARLHQWSYQIQGAWFLLAVVFGGTLLHAPPQSPRYVTLAPVVCCLIAFAVDAFADQASRICGRRRFVAALVPAGLVVYMSVVSLDGYFRDYRHREAIGGANTAVANALARYLQAQPDGTRLWFLGAPRMYYHGFALLEFLAPQIEATDVPEAIQRVTAVPDPSETHPTIYVVLPERHAELEFIQRRFPGGATETLTWRQRDATHIHIYRLPGHYEISRK